MRYALIFLWLRLAGAVCGQQAFNDFEEWPHDYWGRPPQDAATQLHRRLEAGEVVLPAGDPLKFIQAYLRELRVPEASQTMVFSKTALQRERVHAGQPRALYFSDDVAVGYIPGGRVEVAALDPVLGAVFYIFDPPAADGRLPKFERPARCLGCHAGSFTNFLPGLMTNSVVTQDDGRVLGPVHELVSGHEAPVAERWGGWLVTGRVGGLAHLGNQLARVDAGGVTMAPFGDPRERLVAEAFPYGAGSDVAALLVLDHQIGAVNRLIEANYRVRTAFFQQEGEAGAVDDSELTGRVLEVAREQAAVLTEYLLFAREAELPAAGLAADPGFAAAHRAGRPVDGQGRSLGELSLEGRLYRHRCSPLVESAAFRGLPRAFRRLVWQNLGDALSVDAPHPAGAHLPDAERRAIVSILRATQPEFAALP